MQQSNIIHIEGQAASASEALRISGLDQRVFSESIYNPDMRQIEGFQRVGTSEHTYGVTSDRYNIVQNSDALKIMDDVLGAGHCQISTVGYRNHGAQLFIQAKMPHSWYALANDRMDDYLTISTTHDGKGSIKAFFTSVRAFCTNQMSAIKSARLKTAGTRYISIRHNSKANERVEQAGKILMEASNEWEVIREQATILAQKGVNRKQTQEFIERMFPTPPEHAKRDGSKTARETLTSLIETHKGHEVSGGTAWGLFNAATEYFDHHAEARGGTDLTVRSILSGDGFRNRAFEAAVSV